MSPHERGKLRDVGGIALPGVWRDAALREEVRLEALHPRILRRARISRRDHL